MAGTKTSDTKKTKTDTKKTTDPKETNIPDNKPTERTNTKNPDPQKIPDRYLSDTKLQALCAKKFVPGTYKICFRSASSMWILDLPEHLTEDEIVSCETGDA